MSILRLRALPTLFLLVAAGIGGWVESARAQAPDSLLLKSSDGAAQQPRLVITTSTGAQSALVRVQNGLFQLSSTAPVGTVPAGTFRWDTGGGEVRYYDGSAWRVVVSTPTGSPSISAVLLQGATPGTQQTGHLNVSGTAIAGTAFSTSGTVDLPNTSSSSAGVIRFGGSRMLHVAGGTQNLFVGVDAGNFTVSSIYNMGIGPQALNAISTGGANVGLGYQALAVTVSGGGNIAVGYQVLASNTASNNTAMGYWAARSNTSGSGNVAIGSNALYNNQTGVSNVALGQSALYSTAGNSVSSNVAIGDSALYKCTASGNISIGASSSYENTSGTNNTAVGHVAMNKNVTGGANSAFGYMALYNTTGSWNTGFGWQALQGNTSGGGNTALGYAAGNANSTGSNNTFVGYNSGATSSTGLTNATAVGYNAQVTQSNSLILGNAANVGIRLTAPAEALDVNGNLRFTSTAAGQTNVDFYDGTSIAGRIQYTHSSDDMDILVNGSSAIRIDSNRYVGIGVTSLSTKLEIPSRTDDFASVRVGSDTVNDAGIIFFTSSADWTIGVDQSDGGKFKWALNNWIPGNSTKVSIDTGGNIDSFGSGGSLRLGANDWADGGATYGHVISDNTTYKALMIVGNNIAGNSGLGREVKVWDYLNVQGRIGSLNNIINNGPSTGWIGITGDLPGYANNTYPTLKTSYAWMYISVGGAYSAYITTGGVWNAVSDRNKKENFVAVDPQAILASIDRLPMYQWNYRSESPDVRHIAPIAQDFHEAFGLNGEDDKMISHIDPSGIALVGVQALSAKVTSQQERIEGLERELGALRAELARLSTR